jgi:ketosteroid isomerase-like protein
MSGHYETPQDAEDAFYDALEEGDLDGVMTVWAEADDIACLLPMYPLIRGRQDVTELFTHLFSRGQGVALTVTHLDWVHTDDIAIHHVEESIQHVPPGQPPPPPFYGTNIYRKQADGWHLITHLNAPTPRPPEQGG